MIWRPEMKINLEILLVKNLPFSITFYKSPLHNVTDA